MAKAKAEAVAVKEKPAKKEKPEGAVSGNMLDSLKALKGGKAVTHEAVAKITGRAKGNKLRELEELGYVKRGEEEGVRGFVFQITKAGTQALAKS